MDLHIVPGVKANDVAEAHRLDVLIQDAHSCKCMTYWVDESRGHIFCLIDAPDKETVSEMHNKAHGLVPHKIIEVQTSLVESFLGRISDPEDAAVNSEGLKLLTDPSFRTLLVIHMQDRALLRCYHGTEKADAILGRCRQFVQEQLGAHGGVEAEHEGSAVIASFTSAAQAVKCAIALQQQVRAAGPDASELKVGLSAGEPVTANRKLFGDTIELAERICFIAKDGQAGMSAQVNELVSKDRHPGNGHTLFSLSPGDEDFLGLLFEALGKNWQDTEFNIDDYCHSMAMSKSQLYRKTIALTGFSPNLLLKEFRLQKAKDMLIKKNANISQVSFDSGFSSPSYFTKCFKKKYGILPMAYMEMH
jgi:AraC-like DNA-binding protein